MHEIRTLAVLLLDWLDRYTIEKYQQAEYLNQQWIGSNRKGFELIKQMVGRFDPWLLVWRN